jgi:hypothetical protein
VATEIGFWTGRRVSSSASKSGNAQVASITAAALGLLAILIAFTFAMSVSRFDARKQLVVDEADAIGTTYLRARLLQGPEKEKICSLLRRYVEVRLEFYQAGIDHQKLAKAISNTEQMHEQLWAQAVELAEKNPMFIPVGLLVQSLNDTIDLNAKRTAALENNVPQIVLFVLFLVTIGTMGLVGHGCGLSGRRNFMVTTLLSVLLALVILVIVDLDRPRRGLIRVSQESMLALQHELNRSFAQPNAPPTR